MKFLKFILTHKILFILLFYISACNKTEVENSDSDKKIASLNTSTLYLKDLQKFSVKGISKSDSIAYNETYIKKWASDEVFYQQSLTYLSEEEQEITKEIEEYKKQLLTYRFQTKLINEKLDTNITMTQIQDYYNLNSQNFLLKSNILKVLYVKVPLNIPNIEKLKKLCFSNNPKDGEQLKNICIQYANNYFMNDNTWLMLEDLKKEINQLKEVPEYTIQNGKTFEFTDASSYYFLKIIDVKSKNTLSPLSFEKENIKNLIVNQRKQKLVTTIKKDFYEAAIKNKELEIYN